MTDNAASEVERLWLWHNFVGGKPEYWAFDNPFPCYANGDPMTLGEPCGWALFKRSENGRPDVPNDIAEAAIAALPSGDERLREALEPFAGVLSHIEQTLPLGDDETVPIPVRHLRKARAALNPTGELK